MRKRGIQINGIISCNHDIVDFNDLLNKGVKNLLKLDYVYETEDTEKKREIISSMYPEKMTFDGFSVRTNRINEVARLIYSMDVGSSENKNRTNGNNSNLSRQVGMTRFELATSTSQMWRDDRATLRPEYSFFPLCKSCGEGGIRTHGTV